MSVYEKACKACGFPYPPEVFPVGQLGYIVFGVDFSLQRAETSPLWNVLFAEHTCHLENRPNKSLYVYVQTYYNTYKETVLITYLFIVYM